MDKEVGVGDIVLLRTSDRDRPMLVVKVWSPTCVNGIVFVDGYNDCNLIVLGTCLKEGSFMEWGTSISKGEGIGQWHFKE